MKILFNIGHPAHVHLFKNLIWNLEKRGHECNITTVDKEISLQLLEAYGFNYEIIGKAKSSLFSKTLEMIKVEYRLYEIAKLFKPDILVGGAGNVYVAHVGKLIRKPSIVFDDTEHAKIEHYLLDPFASVICTPSSFKKDLGTKQVRYNGYHELAYLHPNYFTNDPNVLEEIGLTKGDNIFLVRFASFDASHDIRSEKFKKEYVLPLIKKLERNGTVIISSETQLDQHLKKYQYKIPPEKYHDILYYSKMYIGEGSTSAEEAAMLGIPSIHFERIEIGGKNYGLSSFIGVLDELQNKYALLYSYYDELELLNKVDELISNLDSNQIEWKRKKNVLLKEKIDVTAFMVWFLENYPESFIELKKNPEQIIDF